MDIDMNLVAGITLGSFVLCCCCVCYIGNRQARRQRQEAKEALRASVPPVEAEVVMSV
jgi:hypothetical protein